MCAAMAGVGGGEDHLEFKPITRSIDYSVHWNVLLEHDASRVKTYVLVLTFQSEGRDSRFEDYDQQ